MAVSSIIAIFAVVLAGVIGWRVWSLSKRINGALGSSKGDLQKALQDYHQRIAEVDDKLDQLIAGYKAMQDQLALASQKIAVVRFNPFGDTGGDQSFALAVLDDHNSGYILTSIHGRTGTRVYVKPIDFGKSKYNLSTEEQQALVLATKRAHKKE